MRLAMWCAALAVALAASVARAAPVELPDVERALVRLAAERGSASESARLTRLFDLHWAAYLREFPDQATYLGEPGYDELWPDLSPSAFAAVHRIARAELAALRTIEAARLTDAERLDLELLRRRLESQLAGERFHELGPFRSELLLIDPTGGVDLDLANLLAYAPARTAADFRHMLARLRGFGTAVDQTIAALRRGLALGITPPRVTLAKVPARVRALLSEDPYASPALAPFAALPPSIAAPEREALRRDARRAYEEVVAPGARRLAEFLETTYVPGARTTIAMSALPDGEAWYAFELAKHTTTSLAPAEIHARGVAEVARIRGEMQALVAASGFTGSLEDWARSLLADPRYFFQKPDDLVVAYRDLAKRIDPELPKLFGRLPRLPYGVKAMDAASAKSAPAAYYDAGAPAAGVPGWFLVNTDALASRPKWAMEALTLHEAVPGHHLQYSLQAELGELPAWRRAEVYPAFSEGWALYAESLGAELGLYRDPASRFGRLSNEMWRALRLVVDTGIHAMGWTRERAVEEYRLSGKPPHEIEAEVDRVISQPGTVPVYKIGEMKIRELRARAERELGARFDVRTFHDHLLGNGQLPLDLLEARVAAWIARTKAAP